MLTSLNDFYRYLMENFNQVLEIISKIKNSGNHFFKSSDFKSAARKYKKAQKFISHLRDCMGSSNDDEEMKIREIEVPICLNIAAVLLKQNDFEAALKECEKVIEIQPENKKALFRRGQARFGLKDYDEALKDLQKVKALEPNDTGVANEIIKVKKAKQSYAEKEKKLYGKMFK